MVGWVIVSVVAAVVVFVNAVATRRLWASEIFETPQKVAQTALLWLLPGSVIVVWSVLRENRAAGSLDPTASGTGAAVTDWLLSSAGQRHFHHGGGDHHGSDGGQLDGGHHHGGDGQGDQGGTGGGDGGGGGYDGGSDGGGGGYDGGGNV